MSSSSFCKSCRSKYLIRDDVSGNLLCSSCGIFQDFDNFEAQLGGLNGPEGTYVRVGTSGIGSVLNYKEKKIYEARRTIDDILFRFELSGPIGDNVRTMVSKITEGEYGQGEWFPILVGACVYVGMRKDGRSLPISEVTSVIGCDDRQMGRMVMRVVDFLDLKREGYPEFDIVGSLERAMRNLPFFSRLGEDEFVKTLKQGTFFIQCAMKWSLTTGRRPPPMVVAVLFLVAELNRVDVTIEDIAKEIHATVSTSKKRYKELLEALVKVAQALPWGKDISMKNIVKNVPFVLQYMEHKSILKPHGKEKDIENVGFDLENVVSECLRKEIEYETEINDDEDESQYFELEPRTRRADDLGKLKISHECLSLIYREFLNEMAHGKFSREEVVYGRKRRRPGSSGSCTDWWDGKSELNKKLLLEQLLEKDVGLDPLPPSFVSNCNRNGKRREKINAAKLRISRIVNPPDSNTMIDDESACVGKKRNRKRRTVVEWEDLIIETLLLHRVKEDEIEKGHYNVLLALYVFNSMFDLGKSRI